MATLQRLPNTLPETFKEQVAALDPVVGCPCVICAHIARVHAHRATHPPRPCTEHRWAEVSRWGSPQRRWLRCSECGEAVEDAP